MHLSSRHRWPLWGCFGLLLCALSLAPVAAQSTASPKTPSTVKVTPGTSARAMAQRIKPEQATIDQTLVALWLSNPRAFVDGNINNLRRDATLQLPAVEDILLIPPQEARAIVAEQTERFRPQPPATGLAEAPSAAAPPLKPYEMRINGVLVPARDVVPLVPPTLSGLPNDPLKPMSEAEKLNRALQDAQSLRLALEHYTKAVQVQLGILERNIDELQRLNAPKVQPTLTGKAPEAMATATSVSPASEASAPSATVPGLGASEAVATPAQVNAGASEPAPPVSAPATEPFWQTWQRDLEQLTLHPALVKGFEQTRAAVQTWWFSPIQILPWWPVLPIGTVASGLALLLLVLLVVAVKLTRRRRSPTPPKAAPMPIAPIMTDIDLNLEPPAAGKAHQAP